MMKNKFNCLFRSNAYPEGLPSLSGRDLALVQLHNVLADHTFQVATECIANSIPVTIENPKDSILWGTSASANFETSPTARSIIMDYCQYGTQYRKSIRLLVAAQAPNFLATLNRRCDGTHEHVNLSGWRPRNKPSKVMRPTHKAAAYPKQLTGVWAAAVQKHLVKPRVHAVAEYFFLLA